jgi:hypothetical protein
MSLFNYEEKSSVGSCFPTEPKHNDNPECIVNQVDFARLMQEHVGRSTYEEFLSSVEEAGLTEQDFHRYMVQSVGHAAHNWLVLIEDVKEAFKHLEPDITSAAREKGHINKNDPSI